jgi:hypothetical protein
MPKKDRSIKEVEVVVNLPWNREAPCDLIKRFDTGPDDVGTYDNWLAANSRAIRVADEANLTTVTVLYRLDGDEFTVDAYFDENKWRLAIDPMVEVERYFERRGCEVHALGHGDYSVERADGSGGLNRKKGYFNRRAFLGLLRLDRGELDEELNQSFRAHMKTSKYAKYSTLSSTNGGFMGSKKGEEKEAKPTAKGAGGKDVELSPKKVEVLEAIRKGEKSGKPYGSGDERLPDPESIAASQLARDGVVHRVKIGVRFHYWASESKAKAELAAAEKEAAKAKTPAKKAAKAPAKKAAAGKAKSGRLKKPSEK